MRWHPETKLYEVEASQLDPLDLPADNVQPLVWVCRLGVPAPGEDPPGKEPCLVDIKVTIRNGDAMMSERLSVGTAVNEHHRSKNASKRLEDVRDKATRHLLYGVSRATILGDGERDLDRFVDPPR